MEAIISNLGYTKEYDVKGRLSVADLFPKTRRCGIYLLKFSDGTNYIGQTVDVVKRFAGHRKKYDNIKQLYFQPVRKRDLNAVEQDHIYAAEEKGMMLRNIIYTTNVLGETDLDLVISKEEQDCWLEEGKAIDQQGVDQYSGIDEIYKIRYRQNFEKLRGYDVYPQLKRILSLYLTSCVPAYKKTEMSFWSLSCLPGTNKNTSPRYICLNINFMEVFVIGYEMEHEKPFAFVVMSRALVDDDKELKRVYYKYKTIDFENSDYQPAGWDQVRVDFHDLDELEDILRTEDKFVESIKNMNLRLMRKGASIFSRYHCFDLVHDVDVAL
jgi:hypothetical protein